MCAARKELVKVWETCKGTSSHGGFRIWGASAQDSTPSQLWTRRCRSVPYAGQMLQSQLKRLCAYSCQNTIGVLRPVSSDELSVFAYGISTGHPKP